MALQTVSSVEALRAICKPWQQAGETIALVPTMGNLHAGHLSIVEQAQQQSQRVVVSIFVNPTQFGPNEDFAAYPRTEAEDRLKLEQQGVDLLFLPDAEIMYPEGTMTVVEVQGLSELYCGRSRPGHFAGVATIVCKLFNIVQANLAFFGEKDFQQLAVIRVMVRDLNIPTLIEGVATVRENDGLAMSSRNAFLTAQQRQHAAQLYQCLLAIRAAILAGCDDYNALINEQLRHLEMIGFDPDYLAICRRSDLKQAGVNDTDLVVLIAAKLGKPRLIDNISFSKP